MSHFANEQLICFSSRTQLMLAACHYSQLITKVLIVVSFDLDCCPLLLALLNFRFSIRLFRFLVFNVGYAGSLVGLGFAISLPLDS